MAAEERDGAPIMIGCHAAASSRFPLISLRIDYRMHPLSLSLFASATWGERSCSSSPAQPANKMPSSKSKFRGAAAAGLRRGYDTPELGPARSPAKSKAKSQSQHRPVSMQSAKAPSDGSSVSTGAGGLLCRPCDMFYAPSNSGIQRRAEPSAGCFPDERSE